MCGHTFSWNGIIPPSHCPLCGAPLQAAPCPYPAPHVPTAPPVYPRPWGPWYPPYRPPYYTSNQVML